MSDWTEVLKVVPKFGVEGNEGAINAKIEEFQEKQINPFVTNIMSNLKMGQLPQFKLRVELWKSRRHVCCWSRPNQKVRRRPK